MGAQEWLVVLALGGLLGAAGQVARIVVGLKKQADTAAANGQSLGESIQASRLVIGLVIGAIAGMLAMLALDPQSAGSDTFTRSTLIALITAGYAGADFIEGFMARNTPNSATSGASRIDGAPEQPQAMG